MPKDQIDSHFLESSELIKESLNELRQPIIKSSELIKKTFKSGGKLLICGNGGSAAESQHFAAELVSFYKKERKALPALSLTTDTSAITSISNDNKYKFNEVFSRQLHAHGKPGDVLFCISTSGNSQNIVSAIRTAKLLKIKSICLTGNSGGMCALISDIGLIVASTNTALIQEVHLVVIHTICDLIESSLT